MRRVVVEWVKTWRRIVMKLTRSTFGSIAYRWFMFTQSRLRSVRNSNVKYVEAVRDMRSLPYAKFNSSLSNWKLPLFDRLRAHCTHSYLLIEIRWLWPCRTRKEHFLANIPMERSLWNLLTPSTAVCRVSQQENSNTRCVRFASSAESFQWVPQCLV